MISACLADGTCLLCNLLCSLIQKETVFSQCSIFVLAHCVTLIRRLHCWTLKNLFCLKIPILTCIPFSSLISPQGKSFTATSWEKKINKLELRINFSIPTLRCCLLKLKYNHLGNSRIFSVVTD